ncbi:Opi1-domain-containing protein [Meredithblackwellia eburnea MCA 4105]
MDLTSVRSSRSQSTSSSASGLPSHEPSTPSEQAFPLDSNVTNDSNDDQDDPALLHDAISALRIMRSGSNSGGPLDQIPPASAGTSPHPATGNGPTARSRDRPSQSRSASTVSTTSGSWDFSAQTSSTGASSPVPANSEQGDAEFTEGDPNFIARVSQFPIVSGSLEWYERSKRSSRVVKYGAGLVESSISTISRPLANSAQLGMLDDFACRQLDRLGAPGGTGSSSTHQDANSRAETAAREYAESSYLDEGGRGRDRSLDDNHRRSRSRESHSRARDDESPAPGVQQAVAVGSRSRWQTVLVEAGGLGAAVSEESLKSLRYCLQWLLYATAHLDVQITTLRDFISSLRQHPHEARSDALITSSAAHLARIKHDVVETIRKVVDVVSKYAGAALPEQAKRYVRQSILSLPMKWATAIENGRGPGARGTSVGTTSSASTPTGDRMEDRQSYFDGASSSGDTQQNGGGTRGRGPEDAAERVLSFAVESLDMLRSVTQIFGESVEKAEAWIERLRVVGLDRQRQRREHSPPILPEDELGGNKRRRAFGPERITADESTSTSIEMADAEDTVVRRRARGRSRETTAQA